MSYTEKRIVESYLVLVEGLSPAIKVELIENLSKSLKAEEKATGIAFYKSFGAFGSEEPPKKLVKEINARRKFRKKEKI